MALFTPLPCGFVAALDVLSDLDADAVTQLAIAALDELGGDATRVTDVVHASLADKAGGAGPPVTRAQLDSAGNALGHVYRAAAGADASAVQLSAGLATFLTPGGPTSTAICAAWGARRASMAAGCRQPGQAAPRLAGLSWEVSAVMASWAAGPERAEVDTTPRPFVAACLRMQGGSDVRVEMSIAQFKDLLAAVRGAHKALAPLTA